MCETLDACCEIFVFDNAVTPTVLLEIQNRNEDKEAKFRLRYIPSVSGSPRASISFSIDFMMVESSTLNGWYVFASAG